MRYVTLILFIFVFQACNSPDAGQEKVYFDLEGFFESEISMLSDTRPSLKKMVYRDQQSESRIIRHIDWEKELRFFRESDINKPAWKKSYRPDTVRISENRSRITYTAIEPHLLTRKVILETDATGKPLYIEIRNVTSNNLYYSYQILKYRPGMDYFIIAFQSVKLLKEHSFVIHSTFLRRFS